MGSIQTFLTKGFIFGIIVFILFTIWGVGGGFSLTYELGKIMKGIPVWTYIVVALIVLTKLMFGGRR